MEQKEKTTFEHFCDFLIRIAYFLIFSLLICLIIGTFLDLDFIPRNSQIYPQSLIIVCLAFIFTLVLSKKYESISIFKILELKRALKDSKNENLILEKKNSELLNHIVSISNTHVQSQSQGVINVNGANLENLKQLLRVKPISTEEKEKQEQAEKQAIQEIEKQKKNQRNEIEKIRKTASLILNTILKDKPEAMKEVTFNNFMYNDPIAKDISSIFDGYYKTFDEEVFIEIKRGNLLSHLLFDRLYIMLNKIYLYRQIKNTNIYLRLILLNLEDSDKTYILKQRIEKYFENAIKNGLLTVEVYGENGQILQQEINFES